MSAMDAFLFPSKYEGLGIVAIEAQSSGLITICSDNVPEEVKITELVEFLPLNINMWINRVKQLIGNRYCHNNNCFLEVMNSQYNIKKAAENLIIYYELLMRR